ncbi:MAG: hypothetical protein BWY14_00220 [Parcubacteria group bacterium ADurb.Bin192]|nr:MAG: hypothetical protein BWY14_00220 [Parcubacteria group bacterium ADurb.Bin192]
MYISASDLPAPKSAVVLTKVTELLSGLAASIFVVETL